MLSAMERTGLDFVFARHEVKYRVPAEIYPELMKKMGGLLVPDLYPESHVLSIYYDTENNDLISRSLSGPAYREKLRLRSYGIPGKNTMVFPELKKKYLGVVYKRRAMMPLCEAELFLNRGIYAGEESQIVRELAYFRDFYHPQPKLFIGYDRKSFMGAEQNDLRITFDNDIRFREDHLSLLEGDEGTPLDIGGDYLMEVKAQDAIPFAIVRTLSELGLYPDSFSKYGTIYTMRHRRAVQIPPVYLESPTAVGAYA